MLRLVSTFAVVAGLGCSAVCQAQDRVLGRAEAQIKVVKGSPFSAEAVTESTQGLADGNRIVHKSTVYIARDSEGRTRREQRVSGGDLVHTDGGDRSVVFIQDPPAGVAYVLEAESRLARKIALAKANAASVENPFRNKIREGINVETESLGMQIIEGLIAQGTRLTRTLSPKQVGNEKPFQVIIEAWYSSELQTVLMSKTTDPRTGEKVYRLTNILREEPTPSLFEVPADYKVREIPQALELQDVEKRAR
jgi:hypothetical protein